jgi:hypothetical protein
MNDFAGVGCEVYTRSMVTLSAVESGGASIMFSPRCQPAWAASAVLLPAGRSPRDSQ